MSAVALGPSSNTEDRSQDAQGHPSAEHTHGILPEQLVGGDDALFKMPTRPASSGFTVALILHFNVVID